MSKKKTIDEFVSEAKSVHSNKYDYSKSVYKDNKTEICIICPKHGEFWQKPYKHLSGQGCPICSKTKKGSTETFIEKANIKHNGAYDYSKVNYENNHTKICIICPEHGEFWQTPHNHLKGQGCPLCAKTKNKPKKYTTKTFIENARSVHGKKYDYTQSVYENMTEKLKIICPEHGEFWQTPYMHLNGAGCPKCAHSTLGNTRRSNIDAFISRANEIHSGFYDYSKVKYITAKHKVLIICPKHGEFWQTPDKHLRGCGCPKCAQSLTFSNNEMEILNYIKNIMPGERVIEHDRSILDGKEIDIYIPSKKIGIEYNGLYWHTKDRNYHNNKLNKCNEKGVRLIQIFEDEYIKNKELILKKITHILGLQTNTNIKKIMGRKCDIKKIDATTGKKFLDKHHIQGGVNATIHLGAFLKDELVGVMSFKEVKRKSNRWELVRFASNCNYICQGVGGKLFKFFIREYNPVEIKSFADRRWTINETENLYTKLGFNLIGRTSPDYRYYSPYDGTIRHHKFGFRKAILHKKYGLPLTMTEAQMTKKLGYRKIYDCGLIKYIWEKEDVN